jgi:thioredoxin reductase (NADPH)
MKRILLAVLCGMLIGAGGYFIATRISAQSRNRMVSLNDAAQKENIIPIAIIGGGPAGLSAALYTSRASLYTVLFQGPRPGGQLTETSYVENWPGTGRKLGSELVDITKKQAEHFGALPINETISQVDFSHWPYKLTTDEGHVIHALTVIIATGATHRTLSVPGEKEYWGKGVTACAICDAPFYKNKKVVVVGGGDGAVEQASLLSLQASKVMVIVRGDKLRAAPAMRARLASLKNVHVLNNREIVRIVGDKAHVTGIEVKNNKDGSVSTLATDGVFLAIGMLPQSGIFKSLAHDEQGYLRVSPYSQETERPGVFAAGDICDPHYRQAGVAAGDGIKAALDAISFLQNNGFTDAVSHKWESRYYSPRLGEKLDMPLIKNNAQFDELITAHDLVAVKVGASTCSSCRAMEPAFEYMAQRLVGKVTCAHVELDDDPQDIVKRFSIQGIPVLLIFKKGVVVGRFDTAIISKQKMYETLVSFI